jgi:capsid protein
MRDRAVVGAQYIAPLLTFIDPVKNFDAFAICIAQRHVFG